MKTFSKYVIQACSDNASHKILTDISICDNISMVTSGCSAVCLFSLVSNCSPPLLVYCIFLGPRGETVALVRYHRRVLD